MLLLIFILLLLFVVSNTYRSQPTRRNDFIQVCMTKAILVVPVTNTYSDNLPLLPFGIFFQYKKKCSFEVVKKLALKYSILKSDFFLQPVTSLLRLSSPKLNPFQEMKVCQGVRVAAAAPPISGQCPSTRGSLTSTTRRSCGDSSTPWFPFPASHFSSTTFVPRKALCSSFFNMRSISISNSFPHSSHSLKHSLTRSPIVHLYYASVGPQDLGALVKKNISPYVRPSDDN